MTPEGHKPSENYLLELSLIAGIVVLSQFAFSKKVRSQIFNRDRGSDVWNGEHEGLEAAHITHDKSDPMYNDPSNGRMLTTRNHYIDHVNRVGRNGLTLAGNNAALRLIWTRLTDGERIGLMPPPEN